MTRQAIDVLAAHVEAFNDGVRTGDFKTMVDGFSPDARMEFRGVPAGPFSGRDAIGSAYREQPPDDEIRILDARERDNGVVVARYAWATNATTQAGEMLISVADGLIDELIVTFDTGKDPAPPS